MKKKRITKLPVDNIEDIAIYPMPSKAIHTPRAFARYHYEGLVLSSGGILYGPRMLSNKGGGFWSVIHARDALLKMGVITADQHAQLARICDEQSPIYSAISAIESLEHLIEVIPEYADEIQPEYLELLLASLKKRQIKCTTSTPSQTATS